VPAAEKAVATTPPARRSATPCIGRCPRLVNVGLDQERCVPLRVELQVEPLRSVTRAADGRCGTPAKLASSAWDAWEKRSAGALGAGAFRGVRPALPIFRA
jgi:hypothetical protein